MHVPPPPLNVACPYCHCEVAAHPSQVGAVISCPRCGGQLQIPWPAAPAGPAYHAGGYAAPPHVREFASKKVAAGICGIMLGGFGVHKFILGFNSAGAIMLTVWLVGFFFGMCVYVPILASMAMGIIGLVEGIIYLTKSDEDFYQTYAIQRRDWF
jgi:TM2 domain-containing membrane protein YozV